MALPPQGPRRPVGAGACGGARCGIGLRKAIWGRGAHQPARLWTGAFGGAADRLSARDAERRVRELALPGLAHLGRAGGDGVDECMVAGLAGESACPTIGAAILLGVLYRDRAAAHRVSEGAERGVPGNSGGGAGGVCGGDDYGACEAGEPAAGGDGGGGSVGGMPVCAPGSLPERLAGGTGDGATGPNRLGRDQPVPRAKPPRAAGQPSSDFARSVHRPGDGVDCATLVSRSHRSHSPAAAKPAAPGRVGEDGCAVRLPERQTDPGEVTAQRANVGRLKPAPGVSTFSADLVLIPWIEYAELRSATLSLSILSLYLQTRLNVPSLSCATFAAAA